MLCLQCSLLPPGSVCLCEISWSVWSGDKFCFSLVWFVLPQSTWLVQAEFCRVRLCEWLCGPHHCIYCVQWLLSSVDILSLRSSPAPHRSCPLCHMKKLSFCTRLICIQKDSNSHYWQTTNTPAYTRTCTSPPPIFLNNNHTLVHVWTKRRKYTTICVQEHTCFFGFDISLLVVVGVALGGGTVFLFYLVTYGIPSPAKNNNNKTHLDLKTKGLGNEQWWVTATLNSSTPQSVMMCTVWGVSLQGSEPGSPSNPLFFFFLLRNLCCRNLIYWTKGWVYVGMLELSNQSDVTASKSPKINLWTKGREG